MLTITETQSRFDNMEDANLTIHKFDRDDSECFVFTNALWKKVWPKKILTDKGTYQYEGNWPMPREAVGHYLGHARFVKVSE